VTEWGRRTYGDPCRECGYSWAITEAGAVDLVRVVPDRYAELLDGSAGTVHGAGLAWSATAYVCHVADNLRIWAERLAGASAAVAAPRAPGAAGPPGAPNVVAAYDENRLAEARAYEAVPIAGALWSLRRAVGDWLDAVTLATAQRTVLVHPERGEMTVGDVARSNAHDAYHHAWDVERIVHDAGPL
jgi:hypothetical protein